MFSSPTLIANNFCVGEQICEVADINGDEWADLVVFTQSTIDWQEDDVWVSIATTGGEWMKAEKWSDHFCLESERCAVGKLNLDAAADIVTFVGNGEVWAGRSHPHGGCAASKSVFAPLGGLLLLALRRRRRAWR
jgi:uncharacterized protein (TIGR03382 family)